MPKTHYVSHGVRTCFTPGNVRTTDGPERVTCDRCKTSKAYVEDLATMRETRDAAYAASTPRQVRNPWNNEPITCKDCGHDKFRDYGRSLWSHNHKCAHCGTMNHTMTETGMSQ